MKLIAKSLIALSACAALQARADETRGANALVLASALVDVVTPEVAPLLAQAFDNPCKGPESMSGTIKVTVQEIQCRVSNVAIGSMSCNVDGTEIKGRQAHELYSLLVNNFENVGEGAAGTMYATTKLTECTVDLGEIASCSGAGAVCTATTEQH